MSPAAADADERAPVRARARREQPWRRHLGGAVTIAVLVILVVLALTKINLADVGHALSHVNGWWVALATALMATTFFARGESWYCAVRTALPGEPIGRGAVTRVLLVGMAGSAVAPGRLGEAARAWLIARRTGRVRETVATVIGTLLSQTLLNVTALVILSIVALSGSAIRGARTESVVLTALLPVLLVLALAGAPALVARGTRSHSRRVRAIAEWLHGQLVDVRQGLRVFRRPRTAVHSIAFQLGGWALQAGSCYAVLAAFGLASRTGFAAAAAVLVAVNITAIVPVTPSNVGVFQAACIAVLAPFGVSAGEGLAYGLVLQAVEVGCAIVLGVPSLIGEGVSLRELRAHAGGRRAAASEGDGAPAR
ncbi:MAG TPA: lysylphosphatidylglycerol synthase transmembrane domain-containing protein [Solirubrobacteraceae bacterium]|nr:lysylphosphatidylglycerol synthase transmembrane domain-containing protein [Solirubrobacteraceae bacterium]